jgi:hypothetical protein
MKTLSFCENENVALSGENNFCYTLCLSIDQGCQMVSFQTKKTNLGIFWKTMEWKMLLFILVIYNILRPLGL